MVRRLLARLKDYFTEEDSGDSVWDPVPSWQYLGRVVEAGGITRLEQEEAVREVEQQAREIEDEINR